MHIIDDMTHRHTVNFKIHKACSVPSEFMRWLNTNWVLGDVCMQLASDELRDNEVTGEGRLSVVTPEPGRSLVRHMSMAGDELAAYGYYLTVSGQRASGPLICTALRMEEGWMDSMPGVADDTRRRKSFIQCLPDAFVKHHQALDAFSSLAMMTDRWKLGGQNHACLWRPKLSTQGVNDLVQLSN